jgi:hypothetical protein
MLLAYVVVPDSGSDIPQLCIVPEYSDLLARPIRIDVATAQSAAVYWVGPKEAFVVENQKDPNVKVIRPVPPAAIFLTPNSPNQPGVITAKIMVTKRPDGTYSTQYSRDSGDNWKPWVANSQGSGVPGGSGH